MRPATGSATMGAMAKYLISFPSGEMQLGPGGLAAAAAPARTSGAEQPGAGSLPGRARARAQDFLRSSRGSAKVMVSCAVRTESTSE